MITEKQITIASEMFQLRDTMRRLFGERWETVTADYRTFLRREMQLTKNANPLSAVIPAAKRMSAAGENPSLLMAVAVDMADNPEPKTP